MLPSSNSPSRPDEMVAVIVSYTLRPDSSEEFLRLAKAHAQYTLHEGKGCIRYDVVWISASKVLFYELYDSAAAFEEHASSQYLTKFRQRRAQLVCRHETELGRLVADKSQVD